MSGVVYFIACEPLGAVKIGYTGGSPASRLASLQTGSPTKLKLLAYFPGSLDDERRLHLAFKSLHIHGDWFRREWKLADFIGYLDEPGKRASRDAFEVALHDVLMQGCWYPDSPITEDAYLKTGDWQPFRELLWEQFGPWDGDL